MNFGHLAPNKNVFYISGVFFLFGDYFRKNANLVTIKIRNGVTDRRVRVRVRGRGAGGAVVPEPQPAAAGGRLGVLHLPEPRPHAPGLSWGRSHRSPSEGGMKAASRQFVNTGVNWLGGKTWTTSERFSPGYFFQPAFSHGHRTLTPHSKESLRKAECLTIDEIRAA